MATLTNFEPIASGFHLEALCPDGDTLWFSDALEPGLRRLAPDGTVSVFLPDRSMIGGILINEGGLVLCSGLGGIAWFDPASERSGMLVDRIGEVAIPGVNEMIPDGRGGIYFGVLDTPALTRGEEMHPWGLYHLDGEGRSTLAVGGIQFPNGLAISADGQTLYCNETYNATMAYELSPGGGVERASRLLDMEDADGIALDATGDIWSVGYTKGDIIRLSLDGTVHERIATPAPGITNIRFGGNDLRDLYVTATYPEAIAQFQRGESLTVRGSRIYRARSDVAGLPIAPTRFELT